MLRRRNRPLRFRMRQQRRRCLHQRVQPSREQLSADPLLPRGLCLRRDLDKYYRDQGNLCHRELAKAQELLRPRLRIRRQVALRPGLRDLPRRVCPVFRSVRRR
jgi:hypothetical protein